MGSNFTNDIYNWPVPLAQWADTLPTGLGCPDQNVIAGRMEYNFDKYDDSYITSYDTEYDYKSIMHYNGYAFSSNGQPTIQAISGDVSLGQIVEMTEKDIIKLEKMYGCRS
uniref:Metalloendopeptidase n=1 Tax=Timema bartmani TaxID=61472 RepID=A0A7R9F4T9_9NEOP|nr:unnamed protein product [Timema bartmani]